MAEKLMERIAMSHSHISWLANGMGCVCGKNPLQDNKPTD